MTGPARVPDAREGVAPLPSPTAGSQPGRRAVKLTIPGHCYSKKNSRDIGFNKKTGRMFPIKSTNLDGYERRTAADLHKAWAPRPPLKCDVWIRMTYYFAGPMPDSLGFSETVYDILQAAGIVANDKQLAPAGWPAVVRIRVPRAEARVEAELIWDDPDWFLTVHPEFPEADPSKVQLGNVLGYDMSGKGIDNGRA